MGRKKQVTMKDVADRVGVSQSTISHVLNSTAPISREVELKVRKAMEEMNYIPNPFARNLKRKKTNVIGLIVPDIENAFYSQIYKLIGDLLNTKGYFTYLCNTSYKPDLEKKYVETFLGQSLDGIIIAYGLINESLYETIYKHNIPLVIIDSNAHVNGEIIPSVQVDNVKGSLTAVKHLKEIGARKICFASEPLFNNTARERYEGFCQAIKKYEFSDDDVRFLIEKNIGDKLDLGYNIGTQIILDGEIDAVYATSDYLAFGIIERIREYDVEKLNNTAVMGFDNINLCNLITPKLTTIAQPLKRICEKGIELMEKLINEEELKEKRFVFEPSIIVRESTFFKLAKE